MKKQKRQTIETKDEMVVAVAGIARLTVEVGLLKAAQDDRLCSIKEEFGAKIDAKQKELKALLAACKVWALENRAEFGEAKSMDMGLAIAGFRTGMPKLSFLKGWTAEKVIEAVCKWFPRRGYVRTIEELDKATIIADRNNLTSCDCDKIGVEIGQEETFFVDVKLEEATRLTERV